MSPITPKLIFNWIIKDIWKITFIGVFFGGISIVYTLSIPNIYTSTAKLSSNLNQGASVGGRLGGLGGLASLAGVSLGGNDFSPEVLKEMLSSSSFIASFIRAFELEVLVITAEGYDASSNKFLLDTTLYDPVKKSWVREYSFPQKLEPSDDELVEKFKDFFTTNFDRKTQIINLSLSFYSPQFSKKTLENLVAYFNEYIREQDLRDSESSIKYLKGELQKANYIEIKHALQQVMEEQFKKLSLAKTRQEYALRYIQKPVEPSKKSAPKRAIICLFITVFGTFFTVVLWWTIRIFRT